MTRPIWVTNEPERRRHRDKVIELCTNYLEGRQRLIEVSRELSSLSHRLRMQDDPDFISFIAIDSETDHLPIGRFRENWALDSLLKKDEEIRDVEAFYKNSATAAAKGLIAKCTAIA
jgi:hypothetical protein